MTITLTEPVGQEVQTPPCFVQKEQVQARAGISEGSGFQLSVKEMLPQWQRPEINMAHLCRSDSHEFIGQRCARKLRHHSKIGPPDGRDGTAPALRTPLRQVRLISAKRMTHSAAARCSIAAVTGRLA